MWSDVIKLRSVTRTYTNGFPSETTTESEVYAKRHSVARSEYYAAKAAGAQTDIAFTIRIADYSGQSELEHNSTVYDVVRTYELDSESIDLTCRRR